MNEMVLLSYTFYAFTVEKHKICYKTEANMAATPLTVCPRAFVSAEVCMN